MRSPLTILPNPYTIHPQCDYSLFKLLTGFAIAALDRLVTYGQQGDD